MEAADERRDHAITGLNLIAEGYTYSADAAQKTHGANLLRAIKSYGGSIAGQPCAAESAAITSLLSDFTAMPELADAIAGLALAPWQGELQAANDAFVTLYQQRTTAYGEASPDTVRGLRIAADAA